MWHNCVNTKGTGDTSTRSKALYPCGARLSQTPPPTSVVVVH
jgi:hypothetical protein